MIKITRVRNSLFIQIGEYFFVGYRDRRNNYIFVCDLGNNCFFKYQVDFWNGNPGDLKEAFKIKYIDVAVE
jgi:hypothetical protein